jgi:hypothetical protein
MRETSFGAWIFNSIDRRRPDIALDCHAGLASRKRGCRAARDGNSGGDDCRSDMALIRAMAIGQCETRKTNPSFQTRTALLRDRTNPGGRAFRLT